MTDKTRGLYGKFRVERTDGKSAPGEKHDGCRYFVLDIDHDRIALSALLAYANTARLYGYHELAADLDALLTEKIGPPIEDIGSES